jgi:hypothetical protein
MTTNKPRSPHNEPRRRGVPRNRGIAKAYIGWRTTA